MSCSGVYKGRKRYLSDTEIAELRRWIDAGETKVEVARDYGISRDTLYEYLKEHRINKP